jgi:hypothetical protein
MALQHCMTHVCDLLRRQPATETSTRQLHRKLPHLILTEERKRIEQHIDIDEFDS